MASDIAGRNPVFHRTSTVHQFLYLDISAFLLVTNDLGTTAHVTYIP
jgi:hypothetical protein